MTRFLIALQFLTIFPVSIKSEIKKEDIGASLLYFPLVGLLIGILLSMSNFLFFFLPVLVRGAFILIICIIISGGVHLDGFADTCDGLGSGRSKEKILEIMRDSHIGVMGQVAIVALLLLKFTLIVSLKEDSLSRLLVLMATFSRWSQSLACLVSGYARDEGKAKYFIEQANKESILIGGIFTFSLFFLMLELKGVFLFILTFFCTLLFIEYMKRKIGGMTGDTIGAVSEIAEVLVLFLVLILLH